MNFKLVLSFFCLVIAFIIVFKQDFVYAQKSYPGVTISGSKNDSSVKPTKKIERKGYKGLISGSHNTNLRTNRGILKSKKQINFEKEQKALQAKRNSNGLSGNAQFNIMEKARAKSEARAKRSELEQRGFKRNKPPQTGDMTYSKNKYSKLKPLDNIKLEALKEDYKTIDIEESMLENMRLPEIMIQALMKNVKMQDGMSITEKSGEAEINDLFAHLEKAKNLDRKERKKIYEQVEDNLEEMQLRYEQEREMPKRILLKFGLPEAYINRKAKELDSVLAMIKSAEKEMKKYR